MSDEVRKEYAKRFDAALKPLACAIESQLRDYLGGVPRIDRVSARAKSINRFVDKALKSENGELKYNDPLRQIQDQVGARVIVYYCADVDPVSQQLVRYFRPIEAKSIVPDSEWEFGYFGRHYILIVPQDLVDPAVDRSLVPDFFELQIKTLFQHAWSEADHDLGYKPGQIPLTSDEKRRLAFTSAQAWGADRIFEELFRERAAREGGGR